MTPREPSADVRGGSNATHELFTGYVEAGFTEDQALAIVIALTTSGLGGAA